MDIFSVCYFIFAAVIGIRWIKEERRHAKVMALFRQLDVMKKQCEDALARGNMDQAKLHHERRLELYEMISREIKKI